MQFLRAFLVLGAATLTAGQSSTVRTNSTSVIVPPIRTPQAVPVIPVIPTNSTWPVQPGKPGYNNGTIVVVVKSYTIWCPEPTVVVVKGKSYTATGPTMLTITNCPCTITTVRIHLPPLTTC